MSDRRRVGAVLLGTGSVLLALAAGGLLLRGARSGGATRLPGGSILLVTLDTTRADHLGCYGAAGGITPAIDALARRGVVLARAQSASPLTLPAHASLLTGRYPFRHGVRNNGMFALPDGAATLATALAGRGYRTAAFVSASVLARRYGLARGFEVYGDDLSLGSQAHRSMVPSRRGEVTAGEAVAWLEALPPGARFFCWVHLYDPHAPYDPPEPFRSRFPTSAYRGEIAYADAMVGRLLAALDRLGAAGATAVAVVGDHGEALGEHGEQTHGLLLHQATLQVPWVMASPGLPQGVVVNAPVSGVDLAPTLLDLVGAPLPDPPLDGRSLLPLLAGGGEDPAGRALYAETLLPWYQYGWSPLRSVLRGRWTLVAGEREELFDLRRDPRELADLHEREVENARALRDDLVALSGADPEPGALPGLALSRSETEMLRSLGYLGSTQGRRARPVDARDLIHAHVHLERARSLAGAARWEDAERELDAMLAADPENVAALAQRAQARLRQRRRDEARADLERVLELDPDDAAAYRALAQVELAAGAPDRALALARAGAGRRGAFESLRVVEASALAALGRRDEAVALLDARLAQRPEDADLLAARASFHAVAGERTTARELLERAVAVDALHLGARLALAEVLAEDGDADGAAAVLTAHLRIDPSNPDVLLRLGTLRLGEPERARPYLEEAVRLEPGSAAAHAALGACYIKLGDHERALAALERALQLAPGDREARNNLGIALTLRGRLAEAEGTLRAVLADAPGYAQARNNLALCLLYQGRLGEAEREARAALAADPALRDAALTLASVLAARSDWAGAEQALAALRRAAPGDLEVAARLGIVLVERGRCAAALAPLREAEVHYGDDLEVLRARARAEAGCGDAAAARRAWERAARLAPPGPARAEALAALGRPAL
jgi:arylsulfatase A-like enzyme/Flp pilus assembly protein TadD